MKKLFLFVLTGLILISNSSFSQKNKFAKENQWELNGTISFTSTTPVTDGNTGKALTIFRFAPTAGYFAVEGYEMGLIVDYTSYSYSGSSSYSDYTLYFAPSYNFKTDSQFYPYVQGQIGYTGISSGSSEGSHGIAWGFEGGIKVNPIGNGLIKFGINYNQRTLNKSSDTERNGYNNISFVLGLGLFF